MTAHLVIGVIGGGAAGVLVGANYIRAAGPAAQSSRIVVIEPRASLGQGVAYATEHAQHVLNVPAGRLSADPDRADDFVSWLQSRGHETKPGDFVARRFFGEYLGCRFAAQVAESGVAAQHIRDRVRHITRTAQGFRLTLESGPMVTVDAAVLAVGNLGPRSSWAPAALVAADEFVLDPWAPGAFDRLQAARSILLVGTGLTMVDVALSLAGKGRTLTAISRSGKLPHSHRVHAAPPVPAPALAARSADLSEMYRVIANHLRDNGTRTGDWRPAFDGLRPITADLWGRLSVADRERAIREVSSCWNRHRHRMAPQVQQQTQRLIEDGQLKVQSAEVRVVSRTPAGLEVELSDGATLSVDAVVNCAGPEMDFRRLSNPLMASMFDSGIARPGPAGMGLDTSASGQILSGDGAAVPGLYTLGATRVGTLWESTAIAEIRSQAMAIATALVGSNSS